MIFFVVGGLFFAIRGYKSYQKIKTDAQQFQDFSESSPRWFWETDKKNRVIYESHHRDTKINNKYLAIKGKSQFEIAEIDPSNEA